MGVRFFPSLHLETSFESTHPYRKKQEVYAIVQCMLNQPPKSFLYLARDSTQLNGNASGVTQFQMLVFVAGRELMLGGHCIELERTN